MPRKYIDFTIKVNFQVTILSDAKNEYTKTYPKFHNTIPQIIRNQILNKYVTDMKDVLTFVHNIDDIHIVWDGLNADITLICQGDIDDCFDADSFHYEMIKNWIDCDLDVNHQKFTFNHTEDVAVYSKGTELVYEKIDIDYSGGITDFGVEWLLE